jgi:Spy/CpxP family protein refolding chaperone
MALGHGLRLPLGQLGLTADQHEKVRAVLAGHRAESEAIRERAVPAGRTLAEAIASGDEAAVRQASSEVAAVQTDRALLAMRVRNEVWRLLTPEQQQKAQEMARGARARGRE